MRRRLRADNRYAKLPLLLPCVSRRARAKARGVKMGRRPQLTDHQRGKAIKRRDHGEDTLAEIGRSCNISGWAISRLSA